MNVPEQTKTDQAQNVIEILPSIEHRAIELRFEGYPYSEIQKTLAKEYPTEIIPHFNTIKSWFRTGGKLASNYFEYAKVEGDFRHKHTQDIFKAHVTTAIQTMVQLLGSPSHMVRMLAAKEILNRQLGEPVKPVLNVSEEKVNEFLEAASRFNPDAQKVPSNVSSGESVSVPQSA